MPASDLIQFHVPQDKLLPIGASIKDADESKIVINGKPFMLRIEDEAFTTDGPRSQLFSLDRENGPNATKLCPWKLMNILAPFLPKKLN